ncbi:MAG TPA: FtsQ-type POTRA domain-containing protein [Longimicrobiales bacterium]|nr:FtsQ-type POTRA domain-containing protein [Longimicrobiales bacterium]
MRRDTKILLVTVCLGAGIAWGRDVPGAIVHHELFRVKDVEVRGLRFLSQEDVVTLLRLAPETSVWGDKAVWADRVLRHPLIKDVAVTRRPPDGLLLTVMERTPIALAPTPTLEPIDAEGVRLPLDPGEYRLDLPVIETRRLPPSGSRLVPEDVRLLAAEVEHLMAADTAFLQLVSSVAWDGRGAVVARWTEPPVSFLLPPHAPPGRLREGLSALADAVAKAPDAVPAAIDLRFADQVVVRRTSSQTGS